MLLALSHVILNFALCSSMAHAKPGTPIAMHVQMLYRVGGAELDTTIPYVRGSDPTGTIEFDVPRGTYRMLLSAPKFDCGVSDFLDFLTDHGRTIAETMTDGPPPPPAPVVLLEGTAPMSFLYAKPTFVLVDVRTGCDQPIGTPLQSHIVSEYDQEGFYTWIHLDDQTDTVTPATVALRLRTPTGLYHYLKLPMTFPEPFRGWPQEIHFDLADDTIESLATRKTDTLLCDKFFITSVKE